MARQVKVEFVGSARDLAEAGLEGQLVLEGFAASAEATETQMSAWKQATQAVGNAMGALSSISQYTTPILVGLAAVLTFVLSPAIVFLTGELGALALGALPLLALGGLAAIFTALAVQTGQWATNTAALDAANTALGTALQQQAQAARNLQEGEVALQGVRNPTELQLMRLQDLQNRYAQATANATAAQQAATTAAVATQNPLLVLRTSLEGVANEVAQRAAPGLGLLFDWLNRLVPAGQTFADRAADWFNVSLPGALHELQGVFGAIGPIIEDIIGSLGKAFDNQLGHPRSFQQAVEVAFSQVRGAINQLLDWLGRLSAWWNTDGQKFAQDAQTDFTVLVGVIEILAATFQFLADTADAAGRAISAVGATLHNLQTSGAANFLGGLGDALSHQYGGSSPAGSWFTAGEAGPELGYAHPGGGVSFFPGHTGPAGGTTYNVTIHSSQPLSERRIVDYLREAELLHGRR